MYHEHPLKIIKNAAKNIWLLVFPLLRGIRTFTLDFNAFYTWIKGAWFDILVILFILGFGYFRWLFTWFRFEKNNVCLISGIFVNKEIIIPYKNISAVTAEHSFFLRPFKAAKVSVDTCAGTFGTSDMSLLIRREDLKMLRRKLPEVHKEGKKTFEFKPKWFTIVFFSFVFSNSLSGIVYLSTFLFQSGRIIKDLLETELVEFIKLANGVSAKLALKIPPAAIILGFLVIITWLFSFAANILRYAGFIMKKDKEETNENDDDNKQQKNADARKVHADAEKTEDLPKNHEKGSETVNFDNQEKQARCRAQAAIWYEDEGFERIQAIRKTLESENRNRFSVNREGICSISIGKRKYRRVGILKGYPFGQTEVIREKLKKDGFITSMGCNNYLWISW